MEFGKDILSHENDFQNTKSWQDASEEKRTAYKEILEHATPDAPAPRAVKDELSRDFVLMKLLTNGLWNCVQKEKPFYKKWLRTMGSAVTKSWRRTVLPKMIEEKREELRARIADLETIWVMTDSSRRRHADINVVVGGVRPNGTGFASLIAIYSWSDRKRMALNAGSAEDALNAEEHEKKDATTLHCCWSGACNGLDYAM